MRKHPKLFKLCIAILILFLLSVFVINFLGKEKYLVTNSDKIAVLGYHNLASDEDKDKYWRFDAWTDSTSSFDRQMKYLYDNGYQTISLDEYYEWLTGKKKLTNKSIVITFDDSYLSTPLLAKPILEKYGFQASTFVIGYSIPKKEISYDPSKKQHIPQEMLKDDDTMKYYSHSYHLHRKIDGEYAINSYNEKKLINELDQANKTTNIEYFAYPFGKYNETAQEVIQKSGTKLAFSYNQFEKTTRHDDFYALPRYSINAYTPMWLFKIMLNQ